jgi:putative serine protease PepD
MGHGDEDEPFDARDHPDEHPDEPDDDAPRGAPPDRLDRNWLHPTELKAFTAPARPAARTTDEHPKRSRLRAFVGAGLAALVGALAAIAILAMTGNLGDDSPTVATGAGSDGVAALTAADAAARLGTSIVTITVRDDKGTRRGSGVCVWHGGGVLTSAQVVGDAKTVTLRTADGKIHQGNVVARDRITDLVLVTVDDSEVQAATLGQGSPDTGEHVWILGAPPPSASEPWMTSGIVTSTNSLVAKDAGPITSGLLETDAASNATAAGGALVDAHGEVTGIVIGHVDDSPTTFAVPIQTAVAIAEELRDNGKAEHGSLGLEGKDAPLPMVMSVVKDGPADKAGIRAGDVVSAVDGRAVDSIGAVTAIIRARHPGETVTISLRRGRDDLTMRVPLGAVNG